MKKWMVLMCCLVFVALMTITVSSVFAAGDSIIEKNFCWRDSYGRGVGKVPQACAEGRDRIGLLCYTKCPAGMKRVGFDCHSICPEGLRNDGLFCRDAEYGRGSGHTKDKCEKENGKGNCEKEIALWYPKCKKGYHNVGCCICRPDKGPDCEKLGLNDVKGIELSCAKKIIIGDPRVGVCPANQERNSGLCYTPCKAGYDGVGPVCWGEPPEQDGKKWVKCGMGAAKTKLVCTTTIFNQVSSVGMLAVNIVSQVVTFGGSAAVTQAANVAENASRLAKLKKQLMELKALFMKAKDEIIALYDKAKPMIDTGKGTAKTGAVLYAEVNLGDDNIVTEEDIARIAAQIAAIVDPTGVADTVAAYTYPKCSKYFPTK